MPVNELYLQPDLCENGRRQLSSLKTGLPLGPAMVKFQRGILASHMGLLFPVKYFLGILPVLQCSPQ